MSKVYLSHTGRVLLPEDPTSLEAHQGLSGQGDTPTLRLMRVPRKEQLLLPWK